MLFPEFIINWIPQRNYAGIPDSKMMHKGTKHSAEGQP